MHGGVGESLYTKAVSNLVRIIQSNTSVKDSLFEQAQLYFANDSEEHKGYLELQKGIKTIEESIRAAGNRNTAALEHKLNVAKISLKKHYAAQDDARVLRVQKVTEVCSSLLGLCEGENWEKTQINSAKLLGTLQLLSPGEGAKLPYQNQKLKPAYKAVIALRLLDKLLVDEQISNQYINKRFKTDSRYPEHEGDLTGFQYDVAMPVVIAALFQDVGSLHPDAQQILKGKDGDLDEFRLLSKDERLQLLKINHEQTLHYIAYGLGIHRYVGNDKTQRTAFEANEAERLNFIRTLLMSALQPKQGLGNLIKVPQIYASVIFSVKQNQNFIDLPKATLIVMKSAENGSVSQVVADCLLSILGHFPQGYGITFIPQDENENEIDRYEYAIVTGLNPEDPYIPVCRTATRNLSFVANGQIISIEKSSNLYFSTTKKKLEKINPARLEEILRQLASNFKERKEMDIIPSYWNPYGFFSYKKLQNLWKRT